MPKFKNLDIFSNHEGILRIEPNLEIAFESGLCLRRDWLAWSDKWMDSATSCVPQYKTALRDPYQLIQASYTWIESILTGNVHKPTDLSAALCLFMIGVFGVTPRVECDLCYRLAIPQRLRCYLHDRSGMLHGSDHKFASKQSQQYAAAKRVCSILDWPKYRPRSSLLIDTNVELNVITGMLGNLPVNLCYPLHHALIDALIKSPTVLQKLPAGILKRDTNSILFHLRTSLDEHEWNFEAWPAKILLAEQWFNALNNVAPGRQSSGISDANKERLLLAAQWQLQGFSKSAIAEKLNISRSHLSHLLNRYETRNHAAS